MFSVCEGDYQMSSTSNHTGSTSLQITAFDFWKNVDSYLQCWHRGIHVEKRQKMLNLVEKKSYYSDVQMS